MSKYRIFLFAILYVCPLSLHATQLEYQDRGGYYEGEKSKPISGSMDITILSMTALFAEATPTTQPYYYHMKFYLPSLQKVYISVIPLPKTRTLYRLDRVAQKWRVGYNHFQWSTEVINRINQIYKGLDIGLYDLGVMARVQNETSDNWIAPIILYYSKSPQHITGYKAVLTMEKYASITCSWYKKSHTASICSNKKRLKAGSRFLCDCSNINQDGEYRLNINAYFLDGTGESTKDIFFYHKREVK